MLSKVLSNLTWRAFKLKTASKWVTNLKCLCVEADSFCLPLAFASKMLAWCRWQELLQSCSLAVPSEAVRPISFQWLSSVFFTLCKCQLAMGNQSKGSCAAEHASCIMNKREKVRKEALEALTVQITSWGLRDQTKCCEDQPAPWWLWGCSFGLPPNFADRAYMFSFLQITLSLKHLNLRCPTSFMTHINFSGKRHDQNKFYWDFY